MSVFRILLVEDDSGWTKDFLGNLQTVSVWDLAGPGYDQLDIRHVMDQEAADRAVAEASSEGYQLVLLDLWYPASKGEPKREEGRGEFLGMRWLPELRRLQPNSAIVIITAYPYEHQLQNVVRAIRDGHANDFVPKTSAFDDIVSRIRVGCMNQRRVRTLRLLEEEFHAMFRSRAASVLADDVGRLIEQSNAEFIHIAQSVESGDPSAISSAPREIRGLCHSLQDRYRKMTGFFASIGEQHLREVNLTRTVDQMLSLYGRRFEEVGARTIPPNEDDGVKVTTYESDVRIALHEVLWNAADALKECQTPVADRRIEVKVTVDPVSKRTVVSVADNGDGFPDEVLAHIFEPRTSTRKDDLHQGIGLYIARHMMEAVGGSIEVRNHAEGGAEVILTIPDLAKS